MTKSGERGAHGGHRHAVAALHSAQVTCVRTCTKKRAGMHPAFRLFDFLIRHHCLFRGSVSKGFCAVAPSCVSLSQKHLDALRSFQSPLGWQYARHQTKRCVHFAHDSGLVQMWRPPIFTVAFCAPLTGIRAKPHWQGPMLDFQTLRSAM